MLEKSLSPNSVEAYLNDIKKLADYCVNERKVVNVEDVTYELLKDYIASVCKTGISNRTQARCTSSIRSLFKFLAYDNIMPQNPSKLLESPKVARKLPNVLTVEEVDVMLNSTNTHKSDGQRNKAIIETLYSCGLRVSELTTLKLSDINFRTSTIKVEGKGNRERIVPLSKTAKREIKLYLETFRAKMKIARGHEDILFLNRQGTTLSRIMIFNIIKNLARKAGINKQVSPHTFRHSFASHLVSGGADLRAVQDMLGHESILTTEIYTHLDNNYLKDTINQYHPRVKKSGK
ncbi:tyrosine recombinase XerC [Bacteroidia bacterium]|nr:tyrosine recombinase XerC [Bacteroidia bacterium]